MALTSPIFTDEDGPEYTTDLAEASWVWNAVVHAIDTAMTIRPRTRRGLAEQA